jgi:hypothetical protein
MAKICRRVIHTHGVIPRDGGNPVFSRFEIAAWNWIPAFAGMTLVGWRGEMPILRRHDEAPSRPC